MDLSINVLIACQKPTRFIDLLKALNITKGALGNTLANLKRKGLIRQESYGLYLTTDTGIKYTNQHIDEQFSFSSPTSPVRTIAAILLELQRPESMWNFTYLRDRLVGSEEVSELEEIITPAYMKPVEEKPSKTRLYAAREYWLAHWETKLEDFEPDVQDAIKRAALELGRKLKFNKNPAKPITAKGLLKTFKHHSHTEGRQFILALKEKQPPA